MFRSHNSVKAILWLTIIVMNEVLHRLQLFRGVKDDFRNRSSVYKSDWTSAANLKVLSSTVFIFFTSFGPAITFSLLLSEATKNEVGAIEVLLATSITGILFALFAGQPLVIVGVTGPVSILTINIYIMAEQWGVKFIPLYAWAQLWGALILMILAALNACDSIKYVTRFSCEVFGVLIAMLYLYTGIAGVVVVLGNQHAEFAAGLLQFIIAIGTLYVAQTLSHAKSWTLLTERSRELLSDYGATISIILWSFVPTMAGYRLQGDSIPTLYVPLSFETSSGRPWCVDFTDIPAWGAFAAIFPGIIIAVLFFFDHNVSSILAQESEMKLQKASAFHLDLFVLGVGTLLTGILGIPPTNGLIPQAPLHTKSLIVKRRVYANGVATDRFEVDMVHEQRVSSLMQSVVCGMACFRPFSDVLRCIPKAVLYGLFLFLGASSFEGNEFAHRANLLIMDPALRINMQNPYAFVREVKHTVLRNFTLIQVVLVCVIFGITFTPAGVIFPVLIAALVYLRIYALPMWFSSGELGMLDAAILSHPVSHDSKIQIHAHAKERLPTRDSHDSNGSHDNGISVGGGGGERTSDIELQRAASELPTSTPDITYKNKEDGFVTTEVFTL